MKVAVIGAGFAGLATSWFLIQKHQCEVTVFDPEGVGGGPSGIAAGLLHCYAGAHAKLNWKGYEGLHATTKLLDVAATALGDPVATHSGLLRLAVTNWQMDDYYKCAESYDDVRWCSPEECQKMNPGVVQKPGIFIESAMTVDTKRYLEGLWKACKGIVLEKRSIQSLEELSEFDQVIVTMGAATTTLPELANIPIKPIKGQLLELEWPEELPPLNHPVNSQAYIVMHPSDRSCIVGATFEKDFDHTMPDHLEALAWLKPKYTAIIPALENAKVINCLAGVRGATPDHRPILKKVSDKCWVLAGLGSKGLLHHALLAEELVMRINLD